MASCMAKCHAKSTAPSRPVTSPQPNPEPSTSAACLAEPYTQASENMKDSGKASATRRVMAAMASCCAIRVGVNAKSIDAHLCHPPQNVGPHVALQVGVELVHVGHHAVKPAVVEPDDIHVLAVRIHHHAAAVVGALRFREVARPLVHPGAVDGVGEETVKVAPVVGHPIVDDADAARVGFTGQVL